MTEARPLTDQEPGLSGWFNVADERLLGPWFPKGFPFARGHLKRCIGSGLTGLETGYRLKLLEQRAGRQRVLNPVTTESSPQRKTARPSGVDDIALHGLRSPVMKLASWLVCRRHAP